MTYTWNDVIPLREELLRFFNREDKSLFSGTWEPHLPKTEKTLNI